MVKGTGRNQMMKNEDLECYEQEFRCYVKYGGKQTLGFKKGGNVI